MLLPVQSLAALLLLLAVREAACVPMHKGRGKGSSQSVSTALLPVEDPSAANLHAHAHASNEHENAAQAAARGEEASFVQAADAEDVTLDCVTEHNKKRVGKLKKPLMPVRRDPAAAYQALKYAKELVKTGCPFKHSQAGGFGENLYQTGGSVAQCQGAVHAWYSEIKYFEEDVWESILASAAHSSSSSWQLSGILLATAFVSAWAAALA